MKLVVDSNRVFAAFIKDSVNRRILFHDMFEFFAPQELLEEMQKYQTYLCEKGALTIEGYNEIYSKLTSTVNCPLTIISGILS
jgi:predicted nucleic acid-binding protein